MRNDKLWNFIDTSDNRDYALVSSGTQFINTGIVFNTSVDSSVSMEVDNQFINLNLRVLWGSTDSAGTQRFYIGMNSTRTMWVGGIASNTAAFSTSNLPLTTDRQKIRMDYVLTPSRGANLYFDDILVSSFANTTLNVIEELCLFNIGTGNNYIGNQKCFGAKIWKSGILVRDFVPVPVGSTRFSGFPAPSNCLWDRVTQVYFENVGSGKFGIEAV